MRFLGSIVSFFFGILPLLVGWFVDCTVMKRVTATQAEIVFLCYINFSDN